MAWIVEAKSCGGPGVSSVLELPQVRGWVELLWAYFSSRRWSPSQWMTGWLSWASGVGKYVLSECPFQRVQSTHPQNGASGCPPLLLWDVSTHMDGVMGMNGLLELNASGVQLLRFWGLISGRWLLRQLLPLQGALRGALKEIWSEDLVSGCGGAVWRHLQQQQSSGVVPVGWQTGGGLRLQEARGGLLTVWVRCDLKCVLKWRLIIHLKIFLNQSIYNADLFKDKPKISIERQNSLFSHTHHTLHSWITC